jgi:hypothetical protein
MQFMVKNKSLCHNNAISAICSPVTSHITGCNVNSSSMLDHWSMDDNNDYEYFRTIAQYAKPCMLLVECESYLVTKFNAF